MPYVLLLLLVYMECQCDVLRFPGLLYAPFTNEYQHKYSQIVAHTTKYTTLTYTHIMQSEY